MPSKKDKAKDALKGQASVTPASAAVVERAAGPVSGPPQVPKTLPGDSNAPGDMITQHQPWKEWNSLENFQGRDQVPSREGPHHDGPMTPGCKDDIADSMVSPAE